MKIECPKPGAIKNIPAPTCDANNVYDSRINRIGIEAWTQRINRAIIHNLENDIPMPQFAKPDWMK